MKILESPMHTYIYYEAITKPVSIFKQGAVNLTKPHIITTMRIIALIYGVSHDYNQTKQLLIRAGLLP